MQYFDKNGVEIKAGMANLKDIYQAAQMAIKPSHTLPNSIRHIGLIND